MDLNRRSLLKGSVAAAAAMPFVGTQARQLDKDIKWDKTADVVIVGYGGAGACAAIEAHDNGASVIILEKMPRGGGNSAVSSGGFMVPKNEQEALKYLNLTYDLAHSEKDAELLKTFCREVMGVPAWMKGLKEGTELWVYGHAGFQNLDGWETIDKWRVRGKGKASGDCYFDLLKYAVEDVRKIPVMLNSPVVQLIRRNDEVVGGVAQSEGKTINIKAAKAVILTTGGYEYDQQTLMNFAQGTQIHALGNPGNTGDGIRLAQSAGARLWHMTAYSCPMGCEIPGCKAARTISPLGKSYIWVNRKGKRFADEYSADTHTRLYVVNTFDPIHHEYPNIPCWAIMDDKCLKRGPLATGSSGYSNNREGYKWSGNNQKEVENGIIIKAATIRELAGKIGVPADVLEATVAKWNADMKAGKDSDFGRPIQNPHKKVVHVEQKLTSLVSEPLDAEGPFYALKLFPSLLNTQGGPKKDSLGRVMTTEDKPVPRLYAAGELGSMWGNIYQGATNNAEAIVFGRISGRAAAAEKPWA